MNQSRPFSPSHYDMELFLSHSGEVQLLMSHFFLKYLSFIYRSFGSDIVMAWILGEIAHHNTTRYFSSHNIDRAALHALMRNPDRWSELEGCNAFSLSQSTGIPRETIRRKVKELVDRGWVENVKGKGLRMTPKCAEELRPDVSVRILDLLLGTAKAIREVMEGLPPPDGVPSRDPEAVPPPDGAPAA